MKPLRHRAIVQKLIQQLSYWLALPLLACAGPQKAAAPSFGHEAPTTDTAVGTAATPDDRDPLVTDGDKYHLVLENEHVRVLRYADVPGAKTHAHYHREFVLYALSPFRRRLIFSDGSVKERDFKPGDVIWMPEQTHTGENIGTTNTDVLIVEIKRRGSNGH